ncbi:MAG TPA: alpha/beta hydrolase [Aldersonia sp.]
MAAMQAVVRQSAARQPAARQPTVCDTPQRTRRAVERPAVVNPKGPSPQARALHAFCRNLVRPAVVVMPLTKAGVRGAFMIDFFASMWPQPPGITVEHLRMPGYQVEIVRDGRSDKPIADGAVLYLHGGGFVCCGRNTHRPIVAEIARRTGLPVVSVEYRQMPKAKISGSVRDCLSAYAWLLEQGVDPSRVVFAGDSAGGFLVFATALRALDVGLPVPAGIVGISALLDLDVTAKLAHPNVSRDSYVVAGGLATICRMGGEVDGRIDPLLSPVNGALAKLPPSFLLAAEDEVLRCDSELMAQRLRAAGVDATLQIWRGQVHAFPALAPGLPESRIALAHISRFIRARIAAGGTRPVKIA